MTLALPPSPLVETLDARLRGSGSIACIEADELTQLEAQTGLGLESIVVASLAWAQRWALAPVSDFQVGAAALAESGRLYLGANIEFLGLPLAHTVHAEQSILAHAWAGGETGLRLLATSAAPCGFCRQFLHELPQPHPRLLLADGPAMTLDELLPAAFGPTELGRVAQLLRAGPHPLALAPGSAPHPLGELALAGATRANAAYTGAHSAVALELEGGQRFVGAVAESVAYNPTLGPMQAALIAAHHGGGRLGSIRAALLVELDDAPVSQLADARLILATVAPGATIERRGLVLTGS